MKKISHNYCNMTHELIDLNDCCAMSSPLANLVTRLQNDTDAAQEALCFFSGHVEHEKIQIWLTKAAMAVGIHGSGFQFYGVQCANDVCQSASHSQH